MISPDADAEKHFAAKIDCRFPYRDRTLASTLIEEGWSISLDAACGVLHEICRKPKSERVTRKRQHALIEEWATRFNHPFKERLLHCAHALVEKQFVPWTEAVSLMEQIGRFDGQYAALNIAYFAGDCCSDESDGELEAAHERISRAWNERRALANGNMPRIST